MRLAEHHGKNYKVISEALAFVGDVRYAANYVSHENQYGLPFSPNGQKLVPNSSKTSNTLIKMLFTTLDIARKSLKMDHVGGILGNAAMVAISMLAFLHLHQVAYKELPLERDDIPFNRNLRRTSRLEGPSPNEDFNNFDVLSARDEVLKAGRSNGRSLFEGEEITECPINMQKQNYTIITSKCKRPGYPASLCCEALLEFCCGFVDEVNDMSTNCAEMMFYYINRYGKYPVGLFFNKCKEGPEGLSCQKVLQAQA